MTRLILALLLGFLGIITGSGCGGDGGKGKNSDRDRPTPIEKGS